LRLGPTPTEVLRKALFHLAGVGDQQLDDSTDVQELVRRATKATRDLNQRVLIIFDQFEEFFILLDEPTRNVFLVALMHFSSAENSNITVLLSLRAEYLSDVSGLSLPAPTVGENCFEVRPFSQAAALQFLIDSGLRFDEKLLNEVVAEAAAIEELPDRIRAIVINMIGMVLASFRGALPRGVNPRRLLLGYVRRAISDPIVRDFAPKILQTMITDAGTKRPRALADIAAETNLPIADVRGCLISLGQNGLVRAFPDRDIEREHWEFSHDFVARLASPLLQSWQKSIWDRTRPWVAPISLVVWIAVIGLISVSIPPVANWYAVSKLAQAGITNYEGEHIFSYTPFTS
jgi:hypothetical protein